jgi:septal ring factor EnvC (AmiA/AmiB activator)
MLMVYAFGTVVGVIEVIVAVLAQRRFNQAQLLLNQAKEKWHNVKRDIENKLYHKESTKDEIESDEKERNELNKQIEESKLKKDIDELTKKRIALEKMLKKEQGEIHEHVGGLDRIQRAGSFHPNYFELKENINKVNLDSILLESKSLLQKINY